MRPQPVVINFAQGLNTKTDPWQIPIGQFAALKNSVFEKGGLLQKRPGYGSISLSTPPSTYITTLNNNLTAIGATVSAYSTTLESWVTKGTLQPCTVSALPLIRNNLNQTQADIAISNGLVLTTYTQSTGSSTQYMYALASAVTGQNIIAPTTIPAFSTGTVSASPRALVVGGYFIIVCPVTVSGVKSLQYVSLPVLNPINLTTNTPNTSAAHQVTSNVYSELSVNAGWDALSANNQLVVAYNSTTGAQSIRIATLSLSQIASGSTSSTILAFTGATFKAQILSICVDATASPNIYYVSFWNPTTTNTYVCAVTTSFGLITTYFAPLEIQTSITLANIASVAQSGLCTIYGEVVNAYTYDSGIPTNYIVSVGIRVTGTFKSVFSSGATALTVTSVVGTPASGDYIVDNTTPGNILDSTVITVGGTYFLNGNNAAGNSAGGGDSLVSFHRTDANIVSSVGLASKPFIVDKTIYFLSVYKSPFQPTYFLINASASISTAPVIAAKLAYQNAGGYLTLALPSVNLQGATAQLPYLFKDDVEALNTLSNPQMTTAGGIYSQTGINLGTFVIGSSAVQTVESASNLHITGGYLSQYDGYLPVEHNFFLFPDSVEATWSATGGSIVAKPDGATNTNAYYVMFTYEWTDNQGLPYRSAPSIPVAITTSGSGSSGSITYNVPTLRLTGKIANKVKLVGYRWSVANQTYFQTTSITHPILNDLSVDYITVTDIAADASIIGNSILYTTGGVVPDFNAPATNLVTEFDNRVWTISAENPNVAFVSKQILQGTPAEFSSQFSIYVSPMTGTTKSLGPVTSWFPMDDKLIFFFRDAMCYINGVGPDALGTTSVGCSLGNYSQPTYIPSTVGCTNPDSIALIPEGLMFQSDKGIWLLDHALGTSYVGAAVEAFNQYSVNSAQAIPGTNYVLFTLTGTDQFLMYDYFYKQWGTFAGVSGISSCIWNDLHTVLDQYGNISQQTPGKYLDFNNPVLMSFTSGWINLASIQGYQRVYDFLLLMNYLSPHYLNCQIAYEYNSSVRDQVIIRPSNFNPLDASAYGDPTPFGSPGGLEQWRIHAKRQLCQSFQLSINEVWDYTLAPVAGAGFTMSGLTANIGVKKGTRPISGSSAAGFG